MPRAGEPYGKSRVRIGTNSIESSVTFRHLWELCPQALEIDKGCKKGWDLHSRCLDKAGNKFLKRDETRSGWGLVKVDLVRSMRRSGRRRTCRGRCRRCVLGDGNDTTHLAGEVEDHVPGDWLLNETDKLRVVEGHWNKGKRVSPRHGKGNVWS